MLILGTRSLCPSVSPLFCLPLLFPFSLTTITVFLSMFPDTICSFYRYWPAGKQANWANKPLKCGRTFEYKRRAEFPSSWSSALLVYSYRILCALMEAPDLSTHWINDILETLKSKHHADDFLSNICIAPPELQFSVSEIGCINDCDPLHVPATILRGVQWQSAAIAMWKVWNHYNNTIFKKCLKESVFSNVD